MRKMMAVMLMGLAFTAAQVESDAQARRKDDRKPAATTNHRKPSGSTSAARPARPGGQPAGKPVSRPARPDMKPGGGPAAKPPGTRPGFAPAPRPPKPPKPVIVVRPSYGTILAANLTARLVREAVRSAVRNSYISYDGLSLSHTYVSAGMEYYYQDGVFYIVDAYGQYRTIVPPTGALVEYLPEDYITFRRSGETFYRVDDTVYALRLIDGQPLFEVLGQLR